MYMHCSLLIGFENFDVDGYTGAKGLVSKHNLTLLSHSSFFPLKVCMFLFISITVLIINNMIIISIDF